MNTVAPPGFGNRGEVRYGSIGGLEYEVPQKLRHLLQCTHILHNFWTSTHRGEASPLPPSGGATVMLPANVSTSTWFFDCVYLEYSCFAKYRGVATRLRNVQIHKRIFRAPKSRTRIWGAGTGWLDGKGRLEEMGWLHCKLLQSSMSAKQF